MLGNPQARGRNTRAQRFGSMLSPVTIPAGHSAPIRRGACARESGGSGSGSGSGGSGGQHGRGIDLDHRRRPRLVGGRGGLVGAGREGDRGRVVVCGPDSLDGVGVAYSASKLVLPAPRTVDQRHGPKVASGPRIGRRSCGQRWRPDGRLHGDGLCPDREVGRRGGGRGAAGGRRRRQGRRRGEDAAAIAHGGQPRGARSGRCQGRRRRGEGGGGHLVRS